MMLFHPRWQWQDCAHIARPSARCKGRRKKGWCVQRAQGHGAGASRPALQASEHTSKGAQKGFTTTRMTMMIMRTVGTSFIIRQYFEDLVFSSRAKRLREADRKPW